MTRGKSTRAAGPAEKAAANRPPPALRRQRLSSQERRAQLLSVARSVFAARGYEVASVDEIAQAAGVSKPIIYEHFGSKDGLHAAVVEREMDELVAAVTEGMSRGGARQRWERAAHAFMAYVERAPDGFAVLTREAPGVPGRKGLTRVIDDLAERISDIFTAAFERAGYEPRVAPIYANALLGSVTQVAQWWADRDRALPLDDVVRHVAALGWVGLRYLPQSPPAVSTSEASATRARGARSKKPTTQPRR
jgi:AcrR family transcriptional regulator